MEVVRCSLTHLVRVPVTGHAFIKRTNYNFIEDHANMFRSCIILIVFMLFTDIYPLPSVHADEQQPHAVVFMYHRFGEAQYPSTNVTIEQFEQQLNYLKENNFTVLPLEEIVEAIQQRQPLPENSVAITIDDAYRSVYEVAYPRLQAMNFPFTVFVATGSVDEKNPAIMSWQQIREMHNNGVTFANHTEKHEYLVRRQQDESVMEWTQRITASIETAQRRLQEELGHAPMLFAYPYGEYSHEVMDIVEKLGYTAFGQHSGGMGIFSNQLALPRFPIAEAFADLGSFRTKARSLPLPVIQQEPVNPLTSESRPELTITLTPADANLEQLACYFGADRMQIEWLIPNEKFSIQATKDLPSGRSRYNCTAPNMAGNRYYWLSHQWISIH
ncbi:polysaccharide deacetylase family protein [Desulfosediminicola ganghwensis]|uniref:polysaccharide deacetylase family protein n=1 Tax=Desulfosediminicola ganghwensis TaxID=2569540 RepID=UPI0010AC31BB|nr:polysaccharide deacetylase family protein [Desulfosediminicola ganghwensis]